MPLHDKIFETNFVFSQDPPMCDTNKQIRGFLYSKYRAIYQCMENLLEDPRPENIDRPGKEKDARFQLSRTPTHEVVQAAQGVEDVKTGLCSTTMRTKDLVASMPPH